MKSFISRHIILFILFAFPFGHAQEGFINTSRNMQFINPSYHGINMVSKALEMKLKWKGRGVNEKAFDESNRCIIECRKKYFRPAEVDTLIGDASKAKKLLKWKPNHNIHSLIKQYNLTQ